MARNEEKAQSMLYRFREAQAAELGLGTRADRRPKMASACKSLRECERWRGEILREISRKVSKIQDSGLTDYEVRDLNDEINKLLREKRHWENQIIALGGANYRRNVAMLDDDGKEVPGTKGYKYFGRAKELPGVCELFQSKKKEEEEESQALTYYKKFMHQGPAYFGDLDETEGPDSLLAYEQAAEKAEWRDAHTRIRQSLNLSLDDPIPELPGRPPKPDTVPSTNFGPSSHPKRKLSDNAVVTLTDGDSEPPSDRAACKRPRPPANAHPETTTTPTLPEDATAVQIHAHAQMVASFIPFLSPESLMPPKLPTKLEMEDVLLRLRKEKLVDEFFGPEEA